jgi:hypothetical protein
MLKIASVIAAIAVTASLGTVSAQACENSVNTASRGNHTTIETDTRGDHYVSLDHDGDFGLMETTLAGDCNKYVGGQYGDDIRSKTKVIGHRNAVGTHQEGYDLSSRTRVMGGWNEVATMQNGSHSRVSTDVIGYDNTVVTRTHN